MRKLLSIIGTATPSGKRRSVRVMSKNEHGEYAVRLSVGSGLRSSDYYTEDLDDAFGTAAHVAGFLEPLIHCERMMNKSKEAMHQEVAFDFLYLVRHEPLPITFRWNGANISLMEESGEYIVLLNNEFVGNADDAHIVAGILGGIALLVAGPGTTVKGEC